MDGDHPAGGSIALAELIDEFGEVLIPDLKHYYQLDLRDLFDPEDPLSPRWVLLHVKNLPLGSSFMAERRGGQEFRGWDESRYINVAFVNGLRTLQHIYIDAHTKGKVKPPEPYPIPDRRKKKSQAETPGSFANIAKRQIEAKKRRKAGS